MEMSNSWDDEEDLTVVEENEKKSDNVPEKDDETVAFARKSSLTSPFPQRNASTEDALESFNVSPFDIKRFPLHAALPKDRFAAFFVDSVLLTYLLIAMQALLRQNLFDKVWFYTLDLRWGFLSSLTSWFLGFALVLFYYVLFESVLSATPGKFLCRLKVVDLDGSAPSLANVFLRNLCRLFDYPLFFFVAVLSMEGSRFYQRLGDRAARTVVVKKNRHNSSIVDIRGITLASTFIRALGFFLDLIFFSAFIWFYLAALNPKNTNSFSILIALFPLLTLGYFMIFEMLLSSTPGKIILKRHSILENGENLDNSAAIIRNLFRPFDVILAYPFLVLSRRKQRMGDYIAETLVIRKEANKEAALAIALLIICILTLGFLSSKNPERKWFLKSLSLPSISSTPPAKTATKVSSPDAFSVVEEAKTNNVVVTRPRTEAKPQTTSNLLKITEFYLSAGPDPTLIRNDALFHPGDLIFAFFKLTGFQKDANGQVMLVEDVQVEAPNGELLINKNDVVKFSQKLAEGVQHVLFANQVILPPNPQVGTYKIILIVHDVNTQSQLVYEKSFTIQ